MKKFVTLLGASTLLLGVLSTGAEAKKVYYEINGKRYSYSTKNRAQTLEAQKRIQAAKALEAAKAKAEAEKAKNPLAAAFGKTRWEVAEAEEKLKQVMSGKESAVEISRSTYVSQPASAPQTEPRTKSKSDEAKETGSTRTKQQTAALVQKPAQPARPMVATPPAVAEPLTAHQLAKKVRSVSFDVESGIKTTIMIDGTIEEEPFDSSVLSQLAPEHVDGNSLMAFVKQLRKVPAEEATGSIAPRPGQPEFAQVNPRLPRN